MASWRLTAKAGCEFIFDCGHTNYFDPVPWRVASGLTMHYALNSQTCFEAFMQLARNVPTHSNQFHIAIKSRHRLMNGHEFVLDGHRLYCTHFKRTTDYLFLVSYSVPFDLPLWKAGKEGRISGQISDADAGGAIADAVVNLNGCRLLTDSNGRFGFHGLSPGRYELRSDVLPKNRILLEGQPVVVDLKQTEHAFVQLAVTAPGKIKGSLVQCEYSPSLRWGQPDELKENDKMKGVPIVLRHAESSETVSSVTDSQGRFQIADLRPGKWYVSVPASYIPAACKLEMNEYAVEVKASETAEVCLRVIPAKKKQFHHCIVKVRMTELLLTGEAATVADKV